MPKTNAKLYYLFVVITSYQDPLFNIFLVDTMTKSSQYNEMKSYFCKVAVVIHPECFNYSAEDAQKTEISMLVLLQAMKIADAELRCNEPNEESFSKRKYVLDLLAMFRHDETVAESILSETGQQERKEEKTWRRERNEAWKRKVDLERKEREERRVRENRSMKKNRKRDEVPDVRKRHTKLRWKTCERMRNERGMK